MTTKEMLLAEIESLPEEDLRVLLETAQQLARRQGSESGTGGIVNPEARRLWDSIPAEQQALLLDNVFCRKCREATTIVEYSGSVEGGDLVLEGRCQRCGSEVTRLIELASG